MQPRPALITPIRTHKHHNSLLDPISRLSWSPRQLLVTNSNSPSELTSSATLKPQLGSVAATPVPALLPYQTSWPKPLTNLKNQTDSWRKRSQRTPHSPRPTASTGVEAVFPCSAHSPVLRLLRPSTSHHRAGSTGGSGKLASPPASRVPAILLKRLLCFTVVSIGRLTLRNTRRWTDGLTDTDFNVQCNTLLCH